MVKKSSNRPCAKVKDGSKTGHFLAIGTERRESLRQHLIYLRLREWYRLRKYKAVVFESGEQEMKRSVRDLLVYNRRRCMELAVRRTQENETISMER